MVDFICRLANFFFNDTELQFDESFEKLFTESDKVKVVLLIGTSRQGKSTLGNYLMNPNFGPIENGVYLNQEDENFEIFPTRAGDDPTTSGIQGTKISARKFKEIHGLTSSANKEKKEEEEEEEDYDIIFLDTEGFGTTLGITGKREHYFICLLTLLGVSSIILDVSKDSSVSTTRIESIKKNIVLSSLIKGVRNQTTYITVLNNYIHNYKREIIREKDKNKSGTLMFEELAILGKKRKADLIEKVNETIVFDSLELLIIPAASRDPYFVCFNLAMNELKQKIINQGEIYNGRKLWNDFREGAKGMYQRFKKCLTKLDDMKKIYYEYLKCENENILNNFIRNIPKELVKYLSSYFKEQKEFNLLPEVYDEINKKISGEFDENFRNSIQIFRNTKHDDEILDKIDKTKSEMYKRFRDAAEKEIISFNKQLHLQKEINKSVQDVNIIKKVKSYEYTRYIFLAYMGKFNPQSKTDVLDKNFEKKFLFDLKELKWKPKAGEGSSYLSSTYTTTNWFFCRYKITTEYLEISENKEKENYKPISYKLKDDDTIYEIKDGLIFPVDGGDKTCNIEYIQLEKIKKDVIPKFLKDQTPCDSPEAPPSECLGGLDLNKLL